MVLATGPSPIHNHKPAQWYCAGAREESYAGGFHRTRRRNLMALSGRRLLVLLRCVLALDYLERVAECHPAGGQVAQRGDVAVPAVPEVTGLE